MIRNFAREVAASGKRSVVGYPVVFVVFNVVYWAVCLTSQPPVRGVRGVVYHK